MCMYYVALDKLNANRARVAVLDVEIPKLMNLAKKLENDIKISTARYGDDTTSIHATGSHGDPTQRRALCDLPEDVRQLLEDIRRLTIERHRTAAWIEMAETALAFLPDRERQIVELRAVEGLSWFDVVNALFDRTGDMISERSARTHYKHACTKIAPFFHCDSIGSHEDKRKYHRSTATP